MRGSIARHIRGGRTALLVALVGGLAAGCRDSGLPDRNLPKAEAERRVYEYPAYQMAAERPVWELGGNVWQASGAVEQIPASMLRQVASVEGATIYALSWDEEPYDRLFTAAGLDRWNIVEPLP